MEENELFPISTTNVVRARKRHGGLTMDGLGAVAVSGMYPIYHYNLYSSQRPPTIDYRGYNSCLNFLSDRVYGTVLPLESSFHNCQHLIANTTLSVEESFSKIEAPYEIFRSFVANLAKKSKNMEPEFQMIVEKRFWDMI